jgi:hypothetical protein
LSTTDDLCIGRTSDRLRYDDFPFKFIVYDLEERREISVSWEYLEDGFDKDEYDAVFLSEAELPL